jgi:TolB protein
MNADGSDVVQLTNNESSDAWPRWSPNGQHIVFANLEDGLGEIFTMNPDGSNPRQVTRNETIDAWPMWSSDEGEVLYFGLEDTSYRVYVSNLDGSSIAALAIRPIPGEQSLSVTSRADQVD